MVKSSYPPEQYVFSVPEHASTAYGARRYFRSYLPFETSSAQKSAFHGSRPVFHLGVGLITSKDRFAVQEDIQPVNARSIYWDQAQIHLQRLLYAKEWVSVAPGEPLQEKFVDREKEQFADTQLAQLFPLVRDRLKDMLQPKRTFYWQYFIDDSTPGHYFGGVGPEVIGTFLITALTMVFAIPLGIISAAYLVECAGAIKC